MSTLYIAFDLFYPAAYRPRQDGGRPSGYAAKDERYDHDDGYFYAVLQPCLISEKGRPPDPSLANYLEFWNAERLARPGAVTFLAAEAIGRLPSELEVTPVPLPADAVLQLSARWAGGGNFSKTRRLGSASSPFAFPQASWPQFAALNYMPVPIRNFSHLDPGQIKELFSWAYGLMQTLERKRLEHEADPGKPALTTHEQGVFERYFAEKPPTPALPGDLEAWWQILVADGKLAALMAELWTPADLRAEPNLNPPGFRYSYQQVTTLGLAVFATPPQSSYHQVLVDKLVKLEKYESALVPPVPEEKRSAPAVLRRYFGFGERLRFPGTPDPASESDFMLLKMKLDQPDEEHPAEGWFVTNAPSLLGQVFRLGPIPDALPECHFQLDALKLCGCDLLSSTLEPGDPKHPRGAIERQFEAAFLEAKSYAGNGTVFSASVTKDSKGDRVSFLPRHARPQPSGLNHPVSGRPLYSVPGSILDLLAAEPRNEMPKGDNPGSDLSAANPQRIMIDACDIAGLGGYTDWQQTKRYLRVKVHLDLVPLAAAPADAFAYHLTLAHPPHGLEAETIRNGLTGAPANEAALWMAQRSDAKETLQAFALAGTNRVLAEAPLKLLVLDAKGDLTRLLPKNPDSGAPGGRIAVDAAWLAGGGANLGASERFNVLTQEADQPVPLIIAGKHFEHRVCRSADRITERFGLKLQPQPHPHALLDKPDQDHDHPILTHFGNFNKLRVDLIDGLNVLKLNHPDALAPADMPPLADANFTYWLAHQFSEEVRQSLADSESNRYQAYRNAGTTWSIAGQVEHQYSHKVPVDGSGTLQLPLSSVMKNLATLSIPNESDQGQPRFALSFDLAFEPEQMLLTLDALCLTAMAAAAAATPALLRPLYEALFDLAGAVQCADPDVAVNLRLERWNFDNSKNPPPPGHVADPDLAEEFPAIASSMRFAGAAERPLTAGELKPFTDLLADDFTAFRGKVAAIKTSPRVEIAVDASWHWTGTGPEQPTPLGETTNVIRLGLRLGRPARRVIGAEYLQSDDQFMPLAAKEGADEESPELSRLDLATLQSAARAEFGDMLGPLSALRASFAWVRSLDDSRGKAVKENTDKDRALKLLGESYRFLNFPDKLVTPVATVVRLFHVPFSFVPLQTHPAFGDPQTTLEFAEFLIGVLASLALGNKPKHLDLVAADPGTSFDCQAELLQLISRPEGLADKICALIQGVDPDDAVADELFQYVRQCLKNTVAERDAVLRALLAADPSIYVSAKAIACAIFDPETYSEKVFAVQIGKHTGALGPVPDDTDRFAFSRFFGRGKERFLVDVLDDKSYAGEYRIRENLYTGDKPRTGLHLRTELQQCGDAMARTGEDVLENENLLNETGTAKRSVQAEVVHYNPKWVIGNNETGDRKYLLPSRRFPRTPKPVLPTGPGNRCTPLEIVFPSSSFDLDAKFVDAFKKALPESIEITASGQSMHAVTTTRGRKAQVPVQQADGWHRLDSYLSHYYFVVEPDEEHSFAKDVFEIVVQRDSEAPFTPTLPISEKKFDPVTDLQKWFVYQRRLEEAAAVSDKGGSVAVEKPQPLSLPKVIAEAESWFTTETSGVPYAQTLLLKPQAPAPVPEHTAVFSQDGDGWVLRNTKGDAGSSMGNVLFAELMEFSGTGEDPAKPSKAVLHLAVLDDVWSYQRVNVRILRNGVDFSANQRLDINERFRMLSPPSEWIDYGRDLVVFSSEGRTLPPQVAALSSEMELATWLNKSGVVDLGPLISQVLQTTFETTREKNLLFWNLRYALEKKNWISALVLQIVEDVHPCQRGTSPVGAAQSARRDILTKQILKSVPANSCDTLTKSSLNKTEIVTAHPHLRVTWWNQQKVPLMEITWPVQWKPSVITKGA